MSDVVEAKLREAISQRRPCDFSVRSEIDDVKNSEGWGDERTVQADFLRAVLLGKKAGFELDHQPLEIIGARIVGRLDLRGASLERPLYISNSHLVDLVDLTDARAATLYLRASKVSAIWGNRALINGSLLIRDCEVSGPLDLVGAVIKGDADLGGSQFGDKAPITANRIRVDGAFYMDRGLRSEAGIWLVGAKIGSAFEGAGSVFRNRIKPALCMDAADISGYCSMARATIETKLPETTGPLAIDNRPELPKPDDVAKSFGAPKPVVMGRPVEAAKSTSTPPDKAVELANLVALSAEGIQVKHFLSMVQVTANGRIFLRSAKIGDALNLSGATLDGYGGITLDLERANITGDVFMRSFEIDDKQGKPKSFLYKSIGGIRLTSASLGGSLAIVGASVEASGIPPNAPAIGAEGLSVKQFLSLASSTVKGQIFLRGAGIGANLNLSGTWIGNPQGLALDLERAKISGDLLVQSAEIAPEKGASSRPAKIVGEVRMTTASIGGSLIIRDAILRNEVGQRLLLNRISVATVLQFSPIESGDGVLSLANAKAFALSDDIAKWPRRLLLNGFDYAKLTGDAPTDAQQRLAWLRCHQSDEFNPQPFTHLAGVLRRSGYERDAKIVAIGRQREARRRLKPLSPRWIANGFMEVTCGHGYRPALALLWALFFIGVGWAVFSCAQGEFAPLKDAALSEYRKHQPPPADYPPLEPLTYSADVFLPIVNLQQKEYWAPDASKQRGYIAWFYRPIHIVAGWFFTTLFVAGVSGLIKRQ